MREIKFRAWDNEKREFLSENYGPISVGDSKVVTGGDWQGVYYTDEYTIEQYTGLKDKNGKEIYVGDVVSEHNGDIVGAVIQKPSGEYRIAWVGIFGGESVLYDHHSLCEVIGNIHENKELLEGEKDD